MEKRITLPKIDYMIQDNSYSGSVGNFRYKIYPKDTDVGKVFEMALYKNNCFDVEDAAGRTTKKEFEYSADGLSAAEDWACASLGE